MKISRIKTGGGFNEYPQSMFWIKDKKICIPLLTPVGIHKVIGVQLGYTRYGRKVRRHFS